MTKQSLMKGTIILTSAAFITRLFGFAIGLMLAKILGPEGVGLMMMAMPLTGLLIILTTLGFPLAISKLVAEAETKGDKLRVKKILVVSLTTISLLSIVIMIGAFLSVNFLSTFLLTDKRAYYSFLALIPIVPLIAISSVFKSYFQGKQHMTPIASSQVLEQVMTIGCIYVFVQWLLPFGIEFAAAGAVLGSVVGEVCSLLYILILFKKDKQKSFKLRESFIKHLRGCKAVLKSLLQIGLPNSGDGIILSAIGMFMPVLITQSLAIAGVETSLATKQFGMLMGYTIPLLMLPGFVTHSLTVSLVPAISEAHEKNDHSLINKHIQQAIKISLVVGVPWTQAVLNGLGKVKVVMLNNLVSSFMTLPIMFLLASNSRFGMNGVAIAMSVGVILSTAFHFFTLIKFITIRLHSLDFVKVILSGMLMGYAGLFMYQYVSHANDFLQLGMAFGFSLFTYVLLLQIRYLSPFKKSD
ncbi:oligosaccharide flippase family protein [Bacillus sp. FJAT-50079]|uniref:putative polysaccharide biosynthesis protein n=1 Tax=Bacillus sp. FJAT-50079 TaxID=2833577 RepID=UPI001BCA2FAE|nr:oligosaccharide flippase family protein [Bacillus sp. FJAT-50079]MBS4207185.1 oligosaccharide flippase family protein [Bacillus sp. FJAT-50079]